MSAESTIFALSSGHGRAGVAVIRVSGPEARTALEALGARGLGPRLAALRNLVDPISGEPIDRALCLWFPGPSSFTGEDVAELHVHGGRAVIDAVIVALSRVEGLAPAEPGAFTRRAFDNDRLDLTSVEGLADLINAETEAQRRQALRQAGGALARCYESWRGRLVSIMAELEAGIDFADEGDVAERLGVPDRAKLEALAGEMSAHLDDGGRAERLREGLAVVIAGPPNAGKSSLLNLLARRDVAIVSETPGTTRDVIEVHLDLGGLPVTLIDTAGLRVAGDTIETEGVARARARVESADLVIWLTDATAHQPSPSVDSGNRGHARIDVVNKLDLEGARAPGETEIGVSVKTGAGIDALLAALATHAGELMAAGGDGGAPTRARHRHALIEARDAVLAAASGEGRPVELIAEDLRLAARALGRITGRVDVEDLLDSIFRDFCIGK